MPLASSRYCDYRSSWSWCLYQVPRRIEIHDAEPHHIYTLLPSFKGAGVVDW